MRRLIVLIVLLVLAQPAWTQGFQQDDRPLVVFVEDARLLRTSSVTDEGVDGISRLSQFFVAQGARTAFVRLTNAIPEDARVIVMARPRQALPPEYLARIYLQLARGAHLLLAIDPPGHLGGRPDAQTGGLSQLLTLDYGVTLLNGLLIEPQFTLDSIQQVLSTYNYVWGDSVPHPIFEPLTRYELPVRVWGARPLRVEPFGVDSFAYALLTSPPVYAETAPESLAQQATLPLELNLEVDPQGLLNVAAVGINTHTGSRLAVIGDGEAVLNGFGLSMIGETGIPRYPGNYVLLERIVAWLMERDEFPPLPTGLTWLELDGEPFDWTEARPTVTDSEDDAAEGALNLTALYSFRNDQFTYMLLETAAPPMPETLVAINIDINQDARPDRSLLLQLGQAVAREGINTPEPLPDAAIHIGAVIELRVPRRVTDGNIISVCVSSALAPTTEPVDCTENPFIPVTSPDRDPINVRSPRELIVTVIGSSGVNMRERPDLESSIVTSFSVGTEFAAVGRNLAGDWILAQDGRYRGWLANVVVQVNGDIDTLPVVIP